MLHSLIYALLLLAFFISGPQFTVYGNRGFCAGLSVFVLIAWLAYFIRKRPLRLEVNLGHILLFSLVGWISIISWWSGTGYLPWRVALQYGALAALVLVLSQSGNTPSYQNFIRALTYVQLTIFALILLDYFTGLKIGVIDYAKGANRVSFTFGNPNYFAAVQLMWLALFTTHLLFCKSPSKLDRNLCVLSLVVSVTHVFLSGSRNAILCGGIFTAIVIFLYYRRSGWKTWHTVSAAIGVALFILWASTVGSATISKTFQLLEGGGDSEMGRLTVWQVALDMWQQSLFSMFCGSGWGALYPMSMNFSSADLYFRLNSVGFRHAHSEPLELLLEGGLIAMAIACSLIIWIFRSVHSQKNTPAFPQKQVIGYSLLLLLPFSFLSVATRYAVVLLPAAIMLGFILRSSPVIWSSSHWINRALVLALLGMLLGNVYISGRDFISDVYLKQALKSTRASDAVDLYEKAVSVSPNRISPRYEQFAFLATRADPSLSGQVDVARVEMDELIPNFKNVAEFHAQYLGSTGDFSGAAKQLSSLANVRSFHLMYLADAMFYYWVSQDHASFEHASRTLLYSAFLAETRGVGRPLVGVKRAETQTSEVVRLQFDDSRMIDVPIDALVQRIPMHVRSNQPILRYYILSEVHRILKQNMGEVEVPRFMELLSSGDRDKVLRLANKLNELDAARRDANR